jgi:hypothetical protein
LIPFAASLPNRAQKHAIRTDLIDTSGFFGGDR